MNLPLPQPDIDVTTVVIGAALFAYLAYVFEMWSFEDVTLMFYFTTALLLGHLLEAVRGPNPGEDR